MQIANFGHGVHGGVRFCTNWACKHISNDISDLFQMAKWFKNDYFEKSKFNSLEIN